MRYSIDYSNPTYLERTAIHEAGHAVVASLSPLLPAVRTVTLNPGGGGFCELAIEELETSSGSRADLLCQGIRVCVAGLLAEGLGFGVIDRELELTNKSRDEGKALALAEMLLADLAAALSPPQRYDARAQRDIAQRVRQRFGGALACAELFLRARWGAVDRVACALLECGSMPGSLVRTLIDTAPERARPSATIEEDMRLMSRAAASDRALGATILRVLKAAA
jgi:ATP-dependent Zn protease